MNGNVLSFRSALPGGMRHRSQVGRVGLQQYPSPSGNVLDFAGDGGLLEGQHPAYAHIPVTALRKSRRNISALPAECVKVAPEMQMPAVLYYAEEFFSGFAQVNVDGQVELGREFKLKPNTSFCSSAVCAP